MPKVKRGQAEVTKGPKNKRTRNEKTRDCVVTDLGSSSAQGESLSEVEVTQMMAPVILHGDAAPGRTGGMDAAPIPTKVAKVLKKMDASKFVLIGLVLTICAFICQLIGLASPYWIYIDLGETKAYGGLWKSCLYNKTFDTTLCDEKLDVLDYMKAVRATSIIGFLSFLVALIMVILKLFVTKDKKAVLFAAIGTAFNGAIFVLTSIAVYASTIDKYKRGTSAEYHFAFAFCIIGMFFALGAGAIMMVDAVKA
uniref:Uncharacterized protein n=1 Tax=Magallana gigas TaxID=29159 RepID=A0A8W8N838_MAGGI